LVAEPSSVDVLAAPLKANNISSTERKIDKLAYYQGLSPLTWGANSKGPAESHPLRHAWMACLPAAKKPSGSGIMVLKRAWRLGKSYPEIAQGVAPMGPLPSTLAAAILTASTALAVAEDNTTIDCSAFQKQSNGSYYAGGTTTVKIGAASMTLSSMAVGPRSISLGGTDLYDAIDRKCGGSPT
jgi:hypothetical protein